LAKFLSKAVRPARAGNLDKVRFDYRVIQRTRVFDQKRRQHTFDDSAGDRSGFTTDLLNIIMVNIEELNEEDQRKYIELQSTSSNSSSLASGKIA
jgi:hypothetical protein